MAESSYHCLLATTLNKTSHLKYRLYPYSRYRTGTSWQVRHEPRLKGSSSPLPRIRLWSIEFYSCVNRPFPSSFVPLFQNESKCETFDMKMSSACSFIFMQIKVIFIRMISHLDSLWNRGTREFGNGLFHFKANQSHCHKNGFALRPALKQSHKGTRKSIASVRFLSRDVIVDEGAA